MTKPVAKWVQIRYATLWKKYGNAAFNHADATKLLKENKEAVSVFLSDLKKAGWLEVSLDPEDTRKRTYRLKSPEESISEIKT